MVDRLQAVENLTAWFKRTRALTRVSLDENIHVTISAPRSSGVAAIVTVHVYGKVDSRKLESIPRASEILEIVDFLVPHLVLKACVEPVHES